MGIAALISSLIGLISGITPDLVSWFTKRQDAADERALLELQHKLQLASLSAEHNGKIEEARFEAISEEIRSVRESTVAAINAGAQPSGVPWVDSINALLRPTTIVIWLVLIVIAALGLTSSVTANAYESLFLLGYLFGYRAGRKRPVRDSSESPNTWRTSLSFG